MHSTMLSTVELIFCLLCISSFADCQVTNSTLKEGERSSNYKRQFSFLQVVKFPNTACAGTGNRNGTCYSTDECLSKKGLASGNCANGFGVCCVFTLGCGQTTSENCTYLTLSSTSTASVPTNCVFSICECNTNICRIRLDFMAFTIAGPVVGTTVAGGATTAVGGAIGDCITDSFILSSPGGKGSPAICGLNTGQHMYVDTSSGSCSQAAFNFGSAANTRNFDIKVTQYSCQDENAGPNDCLQYYSGTEGTIKSFNFANTAAPILKSTTHLSSQCYSICIRRGAGKCAICYSPSIKSIAVGGGADDQDSFGLSTSPVAAAAKSGSGASCATDYLIIPNAINNVVGLTAGVVRGTDRFCGRFFNAIDAQDGPSFTVCSTMRPFRVIFKTDANEMTATIAAEANMNEQSGNPGGIVGFSLNYFQVGC